jgi:hypothetical protein
MVIGCQNGTAEGSDFAHRSSVGQAKNFCFFEPWTACSGSAGKTAVVVLAVAFVVILARHADMNVGGKSSWRSRL